MLVNAKAVLGTIGGGQLEYMAIDAARALLDDNAAQREFALPLGPEIGQCCGGHVTFKLSKVSDETLAALLAEQTQQQDEQPGVYIFGAGHVGRALALALQPLPVKTLLVDNRAEELGLADPNVATRHTLLPEKWVRAAPAGSAFVVLTHDHALDFLITREALARTDAAYVGMIGSKTKRATFVSWLRNEGYEHTNLNALVMPIGASKVSDKRPAVIAAIVAAEIIEALSVWQASNTTDHYLTKRTQA